MIGELESLAKEAGLGLSEVGILKHNYVLEMMQRGLLASIHIGRVRGKSRLNADDIGIELSKTEKKWISLGHQKILPPDVIQRAELAESRGRQNLEKASFQLMMGNFLPITAFDDFKAENNRWKNEFFAVRDEIREKYDEMVGKVREELGRRACDVMSRLAYPVANPASWAERFVENLMNRIPTKKEIYDSFYWEVEYSYVPLPAEVAEDALRQQEIREKQNLLEWESEDRKKKIEEANQMVADSMKKKQEESMKQATQFLDQTIVELRRTIESACAGALKALNRHGSLPGATVKSLRTTIEKVRKLNFLNDKEVNDYIDKLSSFVDKPANNRSTPRIQRVMGEIQDSLAKSLRAVETEGKKEEEICRIVGEDIMRVASIRKIG